MFTMLISDATVVSSLSTYHFLEHAFFTHINMFPTNILHIPFLGIFFLDNVHVEGEVAWDNLSRRLFSPLADNWYWLERTHNTWCRLQRNSLINSSVLSIIIPVCWRCSVTRSIDPPFCDGPKRKGGGGRRSEKENSSENNVYIVNIHHSIYFQSFKRVFL